MVRGWEGTIAIFAQSFELLPMHPHASGPSPSSVGTPGSGNTIKPFTARQFYITGGSVAVAAKGCNMLGDTG